MHHLSFFQGVQCAVKGWLWALSERNLKIHLAALITVTGSGLLVGLERWEWVSVVTVCGLVISAELLNTAIEWLGDIVSLEKQPAMGKVKDVAASAVLAAALTAVVVGCLIFVPHILMLGA